MIEIKHIAMLIAEKALEQSNCKKRQVAFVVFNDKEIVGVSVNEHLPTQSCACVDGIHDPDVLHAEHKLLKQLNQPGLSGVVTYAPCIRCADEIVKKEMKCLFVKQIKHREGLERIKQASPELTITTEWINNQQRIQAAWLLKNVFTQYGQYI